MLVCCYQTLLPNPSFPICCGSSGRFTTEQTTARRVFHHRLSPCLLSLPKTRKPGQTAAERLLPHGHEECRFYNQTSGTSMAFTDSFCVVQMTSTHWSHKLIYGFKNKTGGQVFSLQLAFCLYFKGKKQPARAVGKAERSSWKWWHGLAARWAVFQEIWFQNLGLVANLSMAFGKRVFAAPNSTDKPG